MYTIYTRKTAKTYFSYFSKVHTFYSDPNKSHTNKYYHSVMLRARGMA